ncbi:MAG: hypothetical protein ACREKL_05260 [Chthoniobacterales bacterium]
MKIFTTSFAVLSLAIASAVQAQIKNSDFEFLTADWTQTGDLGNFTAPTSIIGVYRSINPVEGTHFGLVSNEGVGTKTISTTFVVGGDATSAKFLNFEYRFLTDEINQTAFDDSATVVLTPAGGTPVTLVEVSRKDLQADDSVALLDGAAYLDTQTIGQDGWLTSTTDISAFAGKTVTLSITVGNGGDAAFLVDSKLAIDNLRITDVPDTLPPVLKISGKDAVSTTKPAYVIRGTASDKNGIARVEVKVGKAGFKPATGTTNWKFTAKLKFGKNIVQIRSIDGAGNVSKTSTIAITRE